MGNSASTQPTRPNADFIFVQRVNGTQIPFPPSSARHQILQDTRRPLCTLFPRSEAGNRGGHGDAQSPKRRAEPKETRGAQSTSWGCFIKRGLRGKVDEKKKKRIPLWRGEKRWGRGVKTRSLTDFWGPFQHMFWDYIIKNAKDQLKDSSNTWARKDLPKNTQLNICTAIPVQNNSNLLCFHQQVNVVKE